MTPEAPLMGLLRRALLGAGVAVACASPAVGSPVEARPRPSAASPSASSMPPAPAPPAADAEAPERRVWTTKPEQDDCEEFPVSDAPPYSQFDTRSECEVWLAERHCAPGFSCFDGCNTISCDPTGMHLRTTLVDCRLMMSETIEFKFASLALKGSPPPHLAEIQAALEQSLVAPSRKVIVVGHAGAGEANTREARDRLAAGRAEAVRRLLLQAGLPGDRLIARAASAAGTSMPLPEHRSVVSFEFDPDRPTRADASAEELQRRRWCPEH